MNSGQDRRTSVSPDEFIEPAARGAAGWDAKVTLSIAISLKHMADAIDRLQLTLAAIAERMPE
jgi:hypothetical protein